MSPVGRPSLPFPGEEGPAPRPTHSVQQGWENSSLGGQGLFELGWKPSHCCQVWNRRGTVSHRRFEGVREGAELGVHDHWRRMRTTQGEGRAQAALVSSPLGELVR